MLKKEFYLLVKKVLLIIIGLILFISCNKEKDKLLKIGDFQFQKVASLPAVIEEGSGLEVGEEINFWSFNDGNGDAEIYLFDTLGNLLRTLELSDANNIDWEDITRDENGDLYIGDFGNNDNDRQDLSIYKISKDDLNSQNAEVEVTQIKFSFPQQIDFPPPASELFYDVESIFSKDNFLYILTRDRSSPFVGKTTLYRLPNVEGTFEAEFMDEFFTDSDIFKGQITAADFSPNNSNLVMISNEKLWLFQNISDENFFDADYLKFDLPIFLQMEGVVFQNDSTLYLINEKKSNQPGVLYRIKLY